MQKHYFNIYCYYSTKLIKTKENNTSKPKEDGKLVGMRYSCTDETGHTRSFYATT